jgi:LacI family transcriptional regulator
MAGRVTIAQVAADARVSAMTVSNVLNRKPGASDETRRLVLEAVERLSYNPNVAARSLKGGRSGLIGVVTLDLTAQYGLEIVRGIAEELADAERELLINATYHDGARERDRVELLAGGLVDGVLLVAPVLEPETIELIRRRNLPCVVIDPRQLDVPLPRVTVDNYEGMRAGTQHLIDLGHRRIAYIKGEPDLQSSAVRFQGFVEAMRLAGLDIDDRLIGTCDFSYACGFRTAVDIIGAHRPSAILAGADLIALGAVDAARAHGLRVPEDISVVGFDDLPQATQSFPGLTTVRQPLHDMGQTAARALLSITDGQTLLTDDIRLTTSLVVRNSTARAPEAEHKREAASTPAVGLGERG